MKNLKKLRLSRGLTQEKMAIILGVARTTYTQYETEASEPDLKMLKKMSDFFGASIDYILGDEAQKETPALVKKDEREIGYDDFSYALHNESKELTEENKQKLLEMARLFKLDQEQNKNKDKK